MLHSPRRRHPDKHNERNETNGSKYGNGYLSKRPSLPRNMLRRNKLQLIVLSTCLMCFVFVFSPLRQKSFVLLCRLVTLYLQAHCESEDVALWRGTLLKEKIPALDISTKIDLVVSHCDIPVDWIFEWAAPLEFRDILIFSKCGKPVKGAPTNARIIRLDNVGRCDHTYAHYIANYHSKTKDNPSNSDHVLFLKDNDNSHRNHYSRHKNLEEMIPLTREFGFACHEETNWVWSETSSGGLGFHPICQISYYHDWAGLQEFKVEKYSRLRRDDNLQFRSQSGQTLGAYAKQMGIEPPKSLSLSNSAVADVESNTDTIVPVCYGGNFLVGSNQISTRPPGFWERIESSLTRSDNIAEGHFMERLWGTILAKPLQQDLTSRVLRQAQLDVCPVEPNHLGALSKYL